MGCLEPIPTGTACPVMNGANEEAVALFLDDQIGFYDIYELVNRAVEEVPNVMEPTLEDILETDRIYVNNIQEEDLHNLQ